ncbi:MAG: hypothetical protein AAFX99_29570, partial [Myxococcota bacterium]
GLRGGIRSSWPCPSPRGLPIALLGPSPTAELGPMLPQTPTTGRRQRFDSVEEVAQRVLGTLQRLLRTAIEAP